LTAENLFSRGRFCFLFFPSPSDERKKELGFRPPLSPLRHSSYSSRWKRVVLHQFSLSRVLRESIQYPFLFFFPFFSLEAGRGVRFCFSAFLFFFFPFRRNPLLPFSQPQKHPWGEVLVKFFCHGCFFFPPPLSPPNLNIKKDQISRPIPVPLCGVLGHHPDPPPSPPLADVRLPGRRGRG